MENEAPTPRSDGELVTITVKRAHLKFAVVLLIGFVLGYEVARRTNASISTRAVAPVVGGATPTGQPGAQPIQVDVSGRPGRGPVNAPVTLVEFTDYQCPYCARHFRETYEKLIAANPGKLRYVVRNFPVASLHRDAQKAAEAAECAFDQGKFWEFHSDLFRRSPTMPLDTLRRVAVRLGLDAARFNVCLDSGSKEAVVLKDLREAQRYGVIGTPTFFINGKAIVGAQPLAAFQAAIDRATQQR